MPISSVDRIEVAPGPFSSLYGSQALGGVINLITVPPSKREISGSGAFGAGSARSERVTLSYRDHFNTGLGVAFDGAATNSSGFRDESATTISSQATAPAGKPVTPVTGVSTIPTSTGGTSYLLGDRGVRPWWTGNVGLRLYYDVSADTRMSGGLSYAESNNGYGDPGSAILDASGNPVYNGWIKYTVNGATRYTNLNNSTNPFLNFVPSGESNTTAFLRGETRVEDVKIKADLSYSYTNAWFLSPTAGLGPDAVVDRLPLYGWGNLYARASQPSAGDASGRTRADLLGLAHPRLAGPARLVRSQCRGCEQLQGRRQPHGRDQLPFAGLGEHPVRLRAEQDRFFREAEPLSRRALSTIGRPPARHGSTPRPSNRSLPTFALTYPQRNASALSPKASLVYALSDDATLRTSVGRAFRAPDLLQLYSRSQTTLISYTDAAPNLMPEYSTSWEIGGDWKIPQTGAKLRATYFENYLTDFIYTQAVSPTLNLRTNAGAATVRGVEFGLEQKVLESWGVYGNFTRNYFQNDRQQRRARRHRQELSPSPPTGWPISA